MISETASAVERSRTIFATLLLQLPPADREEHLKRHVADLQRRIDGVLEEIKARPPVSVRVRRKTEPMPLATIERCHDAACGHVHAAVEPTDRATIPGAIRVVLANEKLGLLTRQIAESVKLLRPELDATTIEGQVYGALHSMRKRGEVAREGFHKNYRYRIVQPITASSAANGNGESPRREGAL
jgi:hypothetical protein